MLHIVPAVMVCSCSSWIIQEWMLHCGIAFLGSAMPVLVPPCDRLFDGILYTASHLPVVTLLGDPVQEIYRFAS